MHIHEIDLTRTIFGELECLSLSKFFSLHLLSLLDTHLLSFCNFKLYLSLKVFLLFVFVPLFPLLSILVQYLALLVVLLLHRVEINLERYTLLSDVILDHVVARLHVDPASLGPVSQEVYGALQEADLFDDVDDVQFSL